MTAVTASKPRPARRRPEPDADHDDAAPDLAALPITSYAEFGERFFATAVTAERLAGALAGIEGRPIDVGPISVGPISLVKISAQGAVGRPELIERPDPEHVAFDLVIPLDLKMLIEISFDKHRFDAKVLINLVLTARAAEPLLIVIDVDSPTKQDIAVDVRADGLRASVLQVIGGVDGELRRAVAKFVRKEIDKPQVRRQRVIDVGAMLAKATRRD